VAVNLTPISAVSTLLGAYTTDLRSRR